ETGDHSIRDGFGSEPTVGTRRASLAGGSGGHRPTRYPWAAGRGLRRAQRARPRVRVDRRGDRERAAEADEEGAPASVGRRGGVGTAGESRLAAPGGSRLTSGGRLGVRGR